MMASVLNSQNVVSSRFSYLPLQYVQAALPFLRLCGNDGGLVSRRTILSRSVEAGGRAWGAVAA